MVLFIAKRLAAMAGTMLVISLLLFALLDLDHNRVVTSVLGPYATAEQKEAWLENNGYMRPLPVRYGDWLGGMLTGDFGQSTRYQVPVHEVLWPRLWNTVILGAATFMVLVPAALTLGTLAGMREGSWLDRSISIAGVTTNSVPEFASAVFLASLFVFWLGVLPGTSTMTGGFEISQLVLPVAVLVLYQLGYIIRMTRASMAEVMQTAYVRTAILKGLPFRRVVITHALRNALLAPFTLIMLQINWFLSGVIVVEYFFAYKGFGALLLEAALNDDIFVIQACSMIAVIVAVGTQTLADIGYTYLNPRIRFS